MEEAAGQRVQRGAQMGLSVFNPKGWRCCLAARTLRRARPQAEAQAQAQWIANAKGVGAVAWAYTSNIRGTNKRCHEIRFNVEEGMEMNAGCGAL